MKGNLKPAPGKSPGYGNRAAPKVGIYEGSDAMVEVAKSTGLKTRHYKPQITKD